MLISLSQFISRYARRLIVRVTLYASVALLSVGLALNFGPFLPSSWTTYLGADALQTVLITVASSILSVAIFA